MDFQGQKAIYLQIADWLCDKILAGHLLAGDKLPSVRDCAKEVEVNVNTVVRTFEWLQQHNIVAARRSLGNYVTPEARKSILALRRHEFFHNRLPQLFSAMKDLDISIEEVQKEYQTFRNQST